MTDNSLQSTAFDRQGLLQKLAEFEAELGHLPPDGLDARQLQDDVARLRQHLTEPAPEPSALRDAWQSVRDSAHRTADSVENQVLRDSPAISEIGRIIGLL
jgi:alkylhydroperoxidase family enzyme